MFVSAYDNAAVDAFELHALDYLRKPVGRRRVEEAIERVAAAVDPAPASAGRVRRVRFRSAPAEDLEMIAVANLHGGSTRLLARRQVLYVQSYGDFVRIVTGEGRYLLRSTLAEIERRWEPHGFVRVHRQYVANLRNAVELGADARRRRRADLWRRPDDPGGPPAHGRARPATQRLRLADRPSGYSAGEIALQGNIGRGAR